MNSTELTLSVIIPLLTVILPIIIKLFIDKKKSKYICELEIITGKVNANFDYYYYKVVISITNPTDNPIIVRNLQLFYNSDNKRTIIHTFDSTGAIISPHKCERFSLLFDMNEFNYQPNNNYFIKCNKYTTIINAMLSNGHAMQLNWA